MQLVAPLAEADAFEDVDRLAVRMRVPGGARAGREVDAARAEPRSPRGCCDGVDVDGAGEPVTRPGLSVAQAPDALTALPTTHTQGKLAIRVQ